MNDFFRMTLHRMTFLSNDNSLNDSSNGHLSNIISPNVILLIGTNQMAFYQMPLSGKAIFGMAFYSKAFHSIPLFG